MTCHSRVLRLFRVGSAVWIARIGAARALQSSLLIKHQVIARIRADNLLGIFNGVSAPRPTSISLALPGDTGPRLTVCLSVCVQALSAADAVRTHSEGADHALLFIYVLLSNCMIALVICLKVLVIFSCSQYALHSLNRFRR
jgi:hypothetical protein